ncbi:hypothetical protein J2Z62_000179 [Mycoplasmoides fastidiosum]|uniref:Uncharacterized protein n=1 Tax=Mycoplasmoides fastidiosum TaxID=92758 RepID=A0ABU0LYG3_9BACT|nr:hypothetical protein [Mycoplasmoides fastidiosum]MDQ0513741.1 hypothetical protein [Mycoplasmoides fastidiosum]UUD37838.1 hypothetical protein NPA10_00365 [Mycoplasmoides fastidiosum]
MPKIKDFFISSFNQSLQRSFSFNAFFQKFRYKKNHFLKIINLLTWNDIRNVLGLEYRIRFLTSNKIRHLLEHQQAKVLIFIYNDEITKFYGYHKSFIYMDNVFAKNNLNVLDKKMKYIILGFWRNEMEQYRFLKNQNYKVFLQKEE